MKAYLVGRGKRWIAWINSLGNLGGFFGPWYVGLMKDWTGSFAGGLRKLSRRRGRSEVSGGAALSS
jgi:hypothetical protein